MSEKDIASQAKAMLKNKLISKIGSLFSTSESENGMLRKTDVISRFNKGHLVRVSIKGPKHLFVQNYGFEGVKSNGVNMRLKGTDVVKSAVDDSNVLEFLAESLAGVRADAVLLHLKS